MKTGTTDEYQVVSMTGPEPEGERPESQWLTRELFPSADPSNPFALKSADQIFADLEESRRQTEEGEVRPMTDALFDINARYGFR